MDKGKTSLKSTPTKKDISINSQDSFLDMSAEDLFDMDENN